MCIFTSPFLYDGPDTGSGGGPTTPPVAPPSSGAGSPPPAPPAAPPVAGATPPGAPAAPPPAAPPRFEYQEDRTDWLPPDAAAQQRAEAIREANAKAERFRAMAEAAGGVQFPREAPPVDPRVAQARQTMEQIYPGIGQLHEALPFLLPMIQSLQQAKVDPRQFGALPDVFGSVDAQWRHHAATTLEPIHTGVAKDLGVDTLSPRQRDALTRDFMAWLEEDRTGQRLDRYATRDGRLSTEYLDDYRSNFIHPLQRSGGAPPAAGGPPRSAGLPPAPRSGAVPGSALPPAAPPKDLDAAADAAWHGFLAATGGQR